VIPKINAPVREFYVNRGSHVRKGEWLAVLESRDLAAAAVESKGLVDQAEAARNAPSTLEAVEEEYETRRFVRLIAGNGILSELFGILRRATPVFRKALLDALDEVAVAALVDKTIADGRSIGTLNLAMRELGDADPAVLDRLERAIGAGRFLRLIAANGTMFEECGHPSKIQRTVGVQVFQRHCRFREGQM